MAFGKAAVPHGMGSLTINNSIVKNTIKMTFEKVHAKGRADFTAGTAQSLM